MKFDFFFLPNDFIWSAMNVPFRDFIQNVSQAPSMCISISSSQATLDSGVAGGARPSPEFGGSEKGWSLISAYRSLVITMNTPRFKKLSTALNWTSVNTHNFYLVQLIQTTTINPQFLQQFFCLFPFLVFFQGNCFSSVTYMGIFCVFWS